MEATLEEFGIVTGDLVATDKVVDAHDLLRKELLKVFTLKKHIKRKIEEKEQLDEKIDEMRALVQLVPKYPNRPAQVPPQTTPQRSGSTGR